MGAMDREPHAAWSAATAADVLATGRFLQGQVGDFMLGAVTGACAGHAYVVRMLVDDLGLLQQRMLALSAASRGSEQLERAAKDFGVFFGSCAGITEAARDVPASEAATYWRALEGAALLVDVGALARSLDGLEVELSVSDDELEDMEPELL